MRLGLTEDPSPSELTKSSWFAVSVIIQAFRAPWAVLEESPALEPRGLTEGSGCGDGRLGSPSELPQPAGLVCGLCEDGAAA